MVKGSLIAGGTVGALALGGEFLSPRKTLGADVSFPESTCESKRQSPKKILVAYASLCGTTGGVAEAIGRVLCKQGANVEVRLLKNVHDIESYEGVVVGSSVRSGSWLPEAIEFVEKHQEKLKRVPVAYFLTCLTLYRDSVETRNVARGYMNPILKAVPAVQPVDMGFFAGALDYSKLNVVYRMVMKSKMKDKGVPEGDFRNWEAIHGWTEKSSFAKLV